MNDIDEYEAPNILTFKGIFPDKYDINTLFTNKIMDSLLIPTDGATNETEEFEEFDKIPSKFTTVDAWPKKTNLKCWRCNRKFKTIPWLYHLRYIIQVQLPQHQWIPKGIFVALSVVRNTSTSILLNEESKTSVTKC